MPYTSTHTGAQIDNVITNALLKSEASSTYLTINNAAATYLTTTSASSTYLTKTSASSTYQTSTQVQDAIAAAKLAMFPIGSIYTSTSSTNPSTFIGGTWTQIKDTFLLAAGDTYSAGNTGGEATHTMTVDEMPAHRHWISGMSWDDGNCTGSTANSQDHGLAADAGSYTQYDQCKTNGRYDAWCGGAAAGGASGKGTNSADGYTNTAHNNMPPYLVVYVWKRTA